VLAHYPKFHFDFTETQAVTCNFNLKQELKMAKALKAAAVAIQYGCHPSLTLWPLLYYMTQNAGKLARQLISIRTR
jgi:hypothetical protein